jgi:hypothetical protein
MNIFVTSSNPHQSARVLPDKHVVKMPLESCQMLSIVYSNWYYDWGTIPKQDGCDYSTEKGAFRNHPCTKWAAENIYNTAWLIVHNTLIDMANSMPVGSHCLRQRNYFMLRLAKQLHAIVWQITLFVLCQTSSN